MVRESNATRTRLLLLRLQFRPRIALQPISSGDSWYWAKAWLVYLVYVIDSHYNRIIIVVLQF
jgi:hypothetical protein